MSQDFDPRRPSDPEARLEDDGSAIIMQKLQWKTGVPDPLLWLAAQPGAPKFYWRDRDSGRQVACVSATVILSSDLAGFEAEFLEKLSEIARQNTSNVNIYGGFRFDSRYPQERQDPRWSSLGAAWFVLPRFQLVVDKNGCEMRCYFLKSEIGTPTTNLISSELAALQYDTPNDDIQLPGIGERMDTPTRHDWNEQVTTVLNLFRDTDLRKLVLARRTSLRLTARINPWHVLYRLRESADNCFLFGVQAADTGVFIGASPERLYRREGDVIETEAVAGTRPRVADRKEDGRLGSELVASNKDQDEHGIVVSGIREALARLCEKFESTESSETLKLAAVQHLRTSFSGRLKQGVGDPSILPALHPSAAVGGNPRKQAMQSLRQIEAFDRGWYAGPIGWMGATGAEFAVGIRSALVHDNCIDLFAGAGVVPGSTPEAEWNEIESKIAQYLRLFEVDTL